MSFMEDLDLLMWPVRFLFVRLMTPAEHHDFVEWCNRQFGVTGWHWDSYGYMCLKKQEYETMFKLKWA
jgi:hypothetical protein